MSAGKARTGYVTPRRPLIAIIMELKIREYRKHDKIDLEQIVLAVFPDNVDMRHHSYFGEARTTPNQAKTIVAVVAGNLVGFASFYQNRLHYHPHDFRLSIVVAPKFQQKGIGHKLHETLLNSLPHSIARIRTITPEQTSTEMFFKTLQYKPLLRSFTAKLTVQAVDLSLYQLFYVLWRKVDITSRHLQS